MDHRIGTCSSCGARYKIPSSFQADRAKCKKCGGVVEIATSGQAAPRAPASPSRKSAQDAPARKKRDPNRPSMKEQLLARRAAEATATEAETEPETSGETQTSAPARKATSSRAGAAARPPRAGTGAKRASAGRRRSTRRTKSDDGDEDGERGSRRGRRAAAKKGNPVPMFIGSAVVLVLVGYGIWEMVLKTPDPVATEETAVVEANSAQDGTAEADTAASYTDASATIEPTDLEPEPPGVETTPESKVTTKPRQLHDPSSVDLEAIPDYEPFPGTDDATWNDLRQAMAEYIDPNAGAAGNRARKRLEVKPRLAFPVILNFFKRIDFATDEGHRNGDLCQKLLMDLCKGRNFGWKYGDVEENERVTFNKKVVRSWCRAWDQANAYTPEGNQAWAKLSKQSEKSVAAPAAGATPTLDTGDLDDLDDF
jgi:hypothetical protein